MRIKDKSAEQEQNILPEQLQDLHTAAYDAGLACGRDAGYREGFQDGFFASLIKCGRSYPGDLTHCPRCKTPSGLSAPM